MSNMFSFGRASCCIFAISFIVNVFHVQSEITVLDVKQNETVATFEDMEAMFGPGFPDEGISGHLVYVSPRNACHTVAPPPSVKGIHTWIAVIAREDCDFALKVLNVQKAGYDCAIVRNSDGDDTLVRMGGGKYGHEVLIPSVFVGYSSGINLINEYNYKKSNFIVNVNDGNFIPDYKMYLWPFAIVIGTCFILMIVFMVAKYCRDVRRRQRSRLSKKHLKKIPIKKFKKGDYYDVCAICLDDYEEGEKLRVLPCAHAYHVKCIDPWLLKNKKTCPVCKRRVMPGRDAESDSESDEENGNGGSSERTPLLSNQSNAESSRRSTFDTSGLPETVRIEATHQVGTGPRSSPDGVADNSDDESSGSSEGATGGVNEESVEVVVEDVEHMNYGYSSDEDVSAGNNGNDKKRELNQVV